MTSNLVRIIIPLGLITFTTGLKTFEFNGGLAIMQITIGLLATGLGLILAERINHYFLFVQH